MCTSKWFLELFRDRVFFKFKKKVLVVSSHFVSHDFWVVSYPVGRLKRCTELMQFSMRLLDSSEKTQATISLNN